MNFKILKIALIRLPIRNFGSSGSCVLFNLIDGYQFERKGNLNGFGLCPD